jgi:hypothetical protein
VWTNGVQVFRLGLLGVIQIPAQLQIHPEVSGHTKILCQTQSDAGGDALVVGDNFVNALSGHMNELGQFAFINPLGVRNSSKSISPGCVGGRCVGTRIIMSISIYSVVVNNFGLLGSCFGPDETDSILVIDANAMLTSPLS